MTHMLCNFIQHSDHLECLTQTFIFYADFVFLCAHNVCFSALPDSFCNLEIPVINMELDGIFDLPHISPFRNSVVHLESSDSREESEEDCESTAL